jgi:mRNA-degrading endonuclease toxin of MazEF toxin-antitoxin module
VRQGAVHQVNGAGVRAIVVSSDIYNDTTKHVLAVPLLRHGGGPEGYTVTLGEQDNFTGTADVFDIDRVPITAFGPEEGLISGASLSALLEAVSGLFDM